jgi:hypothetical protein
MRDHLDVILADVYLPNAVEVIGRIKQQVKDTDMHIKQSTKPIDRSTESWKRRHFDPVEFEPSMWDDKPGLFIAVVVIVAIISLIVSTLDYWGK